MELEKLISQLDVIIKIDNLKTQVEALKPFPVELEQKILQKLRLDWNYNSNAIEGNPYTYGETLTFIMHGITAKGKTLKDHLDVKGHNDGINFVLSIIKESRGLTELDIRALHKMVLVESYEVNTITTSGLPSKKMILIGDYKKESNHVKTRTGEIHYYASPEETLMKMADLMEWYRTCEAEKEIHPIVIAALFHHKFTEIHPFDDGNGRMARLLMNLILLKAGFPPIVVRNEDKNNYYDALSLADSGEKRQIVDYLGNLLAHSLTIYLKAAKGESIEDESDVDKEIDLFRAGLDKEDKFIMRKSGKVIGYLYDNYLEDFLLKLIEKTKKLSDLFIENKYEIIFMKDNSGSKVYNNLSDIEVDKQSYYTSEVNLNSLLILFNFLGFKKSNSNPFNMDFKILITFYEYDFIIKVDVVEYKFRYELFNKSDITNLINISIKQLILKINLINDSLVNI